MRAPPACRQDHSNGGCAPSLCWLFPLDDEADRLDDQVRFMDLDVVVAAGCGARGRGCCAEPGRPPLAEATASATTATPVENTVRMLFIPDGGIAERATFPPRACLRPQRRARRPANSGR